MCVLLRALVLQCRRDQAQLALERLKAVRDADVGDVGAANVVALDAIFAVFWPKPVCLILF